MKHSRRFIASFLAMALVSQSMASVATLPVYADESHQTIPVTAVADTSAYIFELGQVYDGFKLTERIDEKEKGAVIYVFNHVKSGAQMVYVATEDRHKYFNVVVKTPADDSTGKNHILEHSVLSGSEKFPSKSPFFTMLGTSINTYANALTYLDHTTFPFSSQNDKDFDNLFEVYLDSVLAPKVLKDPNIFMREGWGYDYDAKTKKLSYKGIVYNEMKGSLSSPGSKLQDASKKALFANTKFANISGGDPAAIHTLSYKALVDNYNKYYHPSNMLFCLYGKMDIQNKMKYLNESYLSKYDAKKVTIDYGTIKPLKKPTVTQTYYHADPGAELKDKSIIAFNYGLTGLSEKDKLGLQYLATLLNYEAGQLKADFDAAQLAESYSVTADVESLSPSIQISVVNVKDNQREAIERFFNNEISKQIKTGFDKALLESIFSTETYSKRSSKLSTTRGDSYTGAFENNFVLYGSPTANWSEYDETFINFKKDAIETDLIQQLASKYIVKNNFKATVVISPKVNLNQEDTQRETAALQKYQKSLSKTALNKLIKEIEAFNAWKAAPDKTEDLAKLPALLKEDIKPEIKGSEYKESTLDGVKLIQTEMPSNKTAGMDFYFDLSSLTGEELQEMDLLSFVFFNLGTKNYTVDQLNKTITQKVPTFNMQAKPYLAKNNYDLASLRYVIGTQFNEENIADAADMIQEITQNQKFDDADRIKQKLVELISGYEYVAANNASAIADAAFNAKLTPNYMNSANLDTAGYFFFKDSLASLEKDPKAFMTDLEKLYKKMFNKTNLIVSISGEKDNLPKLETAVNKLVGTYNASTVPAQKSDTKFTQKPAKEAYITSAQVQYIYKGFNTKQIDRTIKGSDFVFAQLLNNNYMYEEMRVKNGAYGAGFYVTQGGNVVFYTSEDPEIKKSLATIDASVDYLKALKLTQADLDPYIIKLIGSLDQPESVFDQEGRNMKNVLSGYSKADQERIIDEVLKTTPEDLNNFIAMIEQGLKNSTTVVAGSESKIKADKDAFDVIVPTIIK